MHAKLKVIRQGVRVAEPVAPVSGLFRKPRLCLSTYNLWSQDTTLESNKA